MMETKKGEVRPTAKEQLWLEVDLLTKLVYKNRSQHRLMKHFQAIKLVLKHVLLWKGLDMEAEVGSFGRKASEEHLTSPNTHLTSVYSIRQNFLSKLGVEEGPSRGQQQQIWGRLLLLEKIEQLLRNAARLVCGLLSLGNFVPLALTLFAVIARINTLLIHACHELISTHEGLRLVLSAQDNSRHGGLPLGLTVQAKAEASFGVHPEASEGAEGLSRHGHGSQISALHEISGGRGQTTEDEERRGGRGGDGEAKEATRGKKEDEASDPHLVRSLAKVLGFDDILGEGVGTDKSKSGRVGVEINESAEGRDDSKPAVEGGDVRGKGVADEHCSGEGRSEIMEGGGKWRKRKREEDNIREGAEGNEAKGLGRKSDGNGKKKKGRKGQKVDLGSYAEKNLRPTVMENEESGSKQVKSKKKKKKSKVEGGSYAERERGVNKVCSEDGIGVVEEAEKERMGKVSMKKLDPTKTFEGFLASLLG